MRKAGMVLGAAFGAALMTVAPAGHEVGQCNRELVDVTTATHAYAASVEAVTAVRQRALATIFDDGAVPTVPEVIDSWIDLSDASDEAVQQSLDLLSRQRDYNRCVTGDG